MLTFPLWPLTLEPKTEFGQFQKEAKQDVLLVNIIV